MIFILTRIQNLLSQHRPHMVEQDVEIQHDHQDSHDRPHPKHPFTLQRLPNINDRESKPHIRKHKRPPIQMKPELLIHSQTTHHADSPEPKRQAPYEHRGQQCQDLDHLRGNLVGTEVIVPFGPILRKPDDRERRETRWANGDEHARPTLRRGEPEVDHPAYVAGVHAHRDEHAEALSRKTREEHRHRVLSRLVCDARGRYRARQHKREDRQVPSWRHVLDLQQRIREEHTIQPNCRDERCCEIAPEQHAVRHHEPVPSIFYRVERHTGDDARQRQEEAAEEERLGWVREARFQCAWPSHEAVADCRAGEREDDEVEDVDQLADGFEPCECVRLALGREQKCEATGCHREGEPRPGEVFEALEAIFKSWGVHLLGVSGGLHCRVFWIEIDNILPFPRLFV